MNYSWYHKSQEFWYECIFYAAFCKPACININKIIKPIMNYNIPFSIIWSELYWVPPIRVEAPIWESSYLGPTI